MDLIFASLEILLDETESVSVGEESRVNKLENFSTFWSGIDSEQFHKGLLVTWAAMWEHSLVVQ
jgi:hypothetical protein